jgi:membrane-associated phospholipid phosphatase
MNSAADASSTRYFERQHDARQRTLRALGREPASIAAAALAYIGIRAVTEGRVDVAEEHAHALLGLEQAVGVAWENAIQSLIIGREHFVAAANWVYIYGHWPVIVSVAFVLFRTRRDRYVLLRNAIFASGAIGFLFFALLPLAPPRLLDIGLVDTVAERSQGYRALQPAELTNQYAAMPSLHFGWNLLVGIVLFGATARLAVRAFALLMPAAMGFAVVATANHFVLDVVAGGMVALTGLALAEAVARGGRFERPRASASGRLAGAAGQARTTSPTRFGHRPQEDLS